MLDGAALDRLHEMFIAVADELGAELALAEVLENWDHTYNGSVMPGSQAQYPQELGMGDMVVAGLPMRPVPWCYFGPAYARLLSGFLSGAPAQWERLRTAGHPSRPRSCRRTGSPPTSACRCSRGGSTRASCTAPPPCRTGTECAGSCPRSSDSDMTVFISRIPTDFT